MALPGLARWTITKRIRRDQYGVDIAARQMRRGRFGAVDHYGPVEKCEYGPGVENQTLGHGSVERMPDRVGGQRGWEDWTSPVWVGEAHAPHQAH